MIKYPNMRDELRFYLKLLGTTTMENYSIERTLEYAVHFFFDDTLLAEDPMCNCGIFLYNDEEATTIGKLCEEMAKIFDRIGWNESDKTYLRQEDWPKVRERAQRALDLILENDEKFGAD